ncbi:MAG: AMP-binding protein [Rhodobiaceae bacterium]|nr:AMP-binding protein [Rhodobiaceae bacterium]MCC0056174.1 AMP-binding protein [Rhodobiaceae bacterium]
MFSGIDPKTLLPDLSILGCLRAAAELEPAKPAIQHLLAADVSTPPRTIAYSELVETIEKAANLFHDASAGQPVSVAVILPMIPESLFASWGAATAGIAVPINPFLEFQHAVSILNTARATVLVTCTGKYGDGLWNKIADIRKAVPTLREVFVLDPQNGEKDFMAELGRQPGGRLNFTRQHDSGTEAFYLPTGGTTAAPKLVRMTHYGQLVNCFNMAALIGSGRDEVVAHALPLFHVGGLVTICLRALIFGQTLVTLTTEGYRNPGVIGNFWKLAAHYGITNVVVTPTTAAAILASGETPPSDHRLFKFFCGGATIPVEVAKNFHRKFGVWLREFWGMSEVYGCVTGQPDDGNPSVPGSVGHVLPFHELKVVEIDENGRYVRDCKTNERGVLAVCGTAVVPGYAQKELDAELFFPPLGDGKKWINTGDLGIIDENGFAWLYGRSKDVIIRGGHNIDPAMIEEVVSRHPAVQLAAAIGRPDRSKGELPMAYVQLKAGAAATSDELLAYSAEHMQERAAVPVEIAIIDQIPITPVGKVFKPALRIDAMKKVAMRTAGEIAGETTKVDVSIDESGKRPQVILNVHDGDAALLKKLDEAFSTFGFATKINAAGA